MVWALYVILQSKCNVATHIVNVINFIIQVPKESNKKSDATKTHHDFDFDSLKSLSDLGIDMSFLPTIGEFQF